MLQDPPAELIWFFQDRRRDAGLRLGQQGGQPLAVDVDAVLDGLVFAQRQGQTVADDLHEPDDLSFARQG